eukprot:TRINITY_DN7706_c0_g1_i1.p1 TRINITY_DN7706_c0_g1~~TRINITY_DN7706_c0_g1_i1.p1  ORF type:complete len:348 (+),score=51.72 TRINITY_DN7706_c0_g1_i1:96-1139(+)
MAVAAAAEHALPVRTRSTALKSSAARAGDLFYLGRQIGSGSFGLIFSGTSRHTGEAVAIKLENASTQSPQLMQEAQLYAELAGGVGIPWVHWYGNDGEYNVMVLDLLGCSLEDHFQKRKRLSLKTVLMVADQMISRLEYVHSKGVVHRDIKPENFMMGLGRKTNQVHIIDFGLSKRYFDSRFNQHIPFRTGKSLIGTARYASLNAHVGFEQSRRDDLESVGNVLLYFCRGDLPWMGLSAKTKEEKYARISHVKATLPVEVLCNGFPSELVTYCNYCRGLRFDATPDYSYIRRLFSCAFFREGFKYDDVFDWTAVPKSSPSPPTTSYTGSMVLPTRFPQGAELVSCVK